MPQPGLEPTPDSPNQALDSQPVLLQTRALGVVECKRNHSRFQPHNLEPSLTPRSRRLTAPPRGLVPEAYLTAEKWLCQLF